MFRDRHHAGRLLAARLETFRGGRPIVFGLTCGGVPVASEVALALDAPLEPMVVRKVGAPGCPECTIGAIAEGGGAWVNRDALREVGLSIDDFAAMAGYEAVDLARRMRAYRGDRPFPRVGGRTVLLVDDGVATGATARAAARSARHAGAARVLLAAPVIAAAIEPELRATFDEVVAVDLPQDFIAVGAWYERFEQVSDAEVLHHLGREREPARATDAGEPWNGVWIEPEPAGEVREELLAIPLDASRSGAGTFEATLTTPAGARGLVMLVQGGGSSRSSPRVRYVARRLQRAGFATVVLDAPAREVEEDEAMVLAGRVLAAARWLAAFPPTRSLAFGYFGTNTGGAAALIAAAAGPDLVAAVVSGGGRCDLVHVETLEDVHAPVLLVVGHKDEEVLKVNRAILMRLRNAQLEIVRGATHRLEQPGALDTVVRLATGWFQRLAAAGLGPRTPTAEITPG